MYACSGAGPNSVVSTAPMMPMHFLQDKIDCRFAWFPSQMQLQPIYIISKHTWFGRDLCESLTGTRDCLVLTQRATLHRQERRHTRPRRRSTWSDRLFVHKLDCCCCLFLQQVQVGTIHVPSRRGLASSFEESPLDDAVL